MTTPRSVYLGWDPREDVAWRVARASLLRHCSEPIPTHKLALGSLRGSGMYARPTRVNGHRIVDELSAREDYDGRCSTQHAIARFFVPQLAQAGWALFADGDVLFLGDVAEVFRDLDPAMAIYCVKHDYAPTQTAKMDGQLQTRYARKNWSSFAIFNCDHPSNGRLGEIVNVLPGRDLHAFCWLDDSEIGALDARWNYLVGHNTVVDCASPRVVHFTQGLPSMAGYESCEYASEWRQELRRLERRAA